MESPKDWRDALSSLLPENFTPEEEQTAETDQLHSSHFSKKQKLRIDIEKKGRGGKTATIISGFDIPDEEVEEIASVLKKRLACGGSARGGEILIQGDRRDDARKILKNIGVIN